MNDTLDKELDKKIALHNEHKLVQEESICNPISLSTYIQASTSQNTRRVYQQDIRHFVHSGRLLPATPESVIGYLQQYAVSLNVRTLARRLTAIKQWHTCQGFADPTSHLLVRKALTGIKNIHGKPKDKAAALEVNELMMMASFLKKRGRLIDIRNNALLQVGFFGAFRRSELAGMSLEHVFYLAEGIEILIPRSKTDPGGEGQRCAIPYGNEVLCPVRALKTWCEVAGIMQGPLFCRITKGGKLIPKAINAHQISIIIKEVAEQCNLSHAQELSSHSLRRGFATTAARQGASLAAIMQQGRWQHTGTALGYMEEGKRFDGNAAGLILTKNSRPENNLDERKS